MHINYSKIQKEEECTTLQEIKILLLSINNIMDSEASLVVSDLVEE
jgi:hypothetical protein